MRKHRRFEQNSGELLTVQCPCMTPRDLMRLVCDDVEVEVKSRGGTYNNGSEEFPIPRTMDIEKFRRMSSPRPVDRRTDEPPTPPTPPTE